MEKGKEDHTIVLVTSYWKGFFQSVIWLVVLTACIFLAVLLKSTAMQWVVSIIWFIAVFGFAIQSQKKVRFTLDDAIERLAELKSKQ